MKLLILLFSLVLSSSAFAFSDLDNLEPNQEYIELPKDVTGNIFVRQKVDVDGNPVGEIEIVQSVDKFLSTDNLVVNESLKEDIASLNFTSLAPGEEGLEIDHMNGRQSFVFWGGFGGYGWGLSFGFGSYNNWYRPYAGWGWGGYRYGCWW